MQDPFPALGFFQDGPAAAAANLLGIGLAVCGVVAFTYGATYAFFYLIGVPRTAPRMRSQVLWMSWLQLSFVVRMMGPPGFRRVPVLVFAVISMSLIYPLVLWLGRGDNRGNHPPDSRSV